MLLDAVAAHFTKCVQLCLSSSKTAYSTISDLNAHPDIAFACLCFFAGAAPLFAAAQSGHVEAIAILLAAGASVAAVDVHGHSCLGLPGTAKQQQ
jgi:hypothetical protein